MNNTISSFPSDGSRVGQFSGSDSLLRVTDLCRLLQISKSTVYNRLDPRSSQYDAEFPKQIPLGRGSRCAVRFSSSAVFEYIHKRSVER